MGDISDYVELSPFVNLFEDTYVVIVSEFFIEHSDESVGVDEAQTSIDRITDREVVDGIDRLENVGVLSNEDGGYTLDLENDIAQALLNAYEAMEG